MKPLLVFILLACTKQQYMFHCNTKLFVLVKYFTGYFFEWLHLLPSMIKLPKVTKLINQNGCINLLTRHQNMFKPGLKPQVGKRSVTTLSGRCRASEMVRNAEGSRSQVIKRISESRLNLNRKPIFLKFLFRVHWGWRLKKLYLIPKTF